MTELVAAPAPSAQPYVPVSSTDPTGGRLVAWADALSAAHKIGSALCQTAFAPAHFKGKAEEAAVAILYGDEVGFTPTAALQNVFVISGKPGLYARAMVALVQSKGHEVWTEEATDRKVIVCGRRNGSSRVERSEWTIDKARKAGYTNNKKYNEAPEDMLYARAAATVCRRVAADALAGLAYSVEELELDSPGKTTTVTRGTTAEPKPTTVQRKKTEPEPTPEPSFDEPTEPHPDLITDSQSKKLHAQFNDAGITDREGRLAFASEVAGRALASSNELTKDEASRVIDALDNLDPAADATELPIGGE